MTIKEIISILEELAPLGNAEDFDNVGLLVGDKTKAVSGVLVTLDTLENVVDEAIENKCNLIVSFHPIIFSGLKKLTGSNYVERVVLKAIKNDVAIYSMHTALDNVQQGVNAKICEVLGIEDPKILIPKKNSLQKLTTYVPKAHAQHILEALFNAGAGHIGNYSNCSFSVNGLGSYEAMEGANPTIGKIGQTHYEEETMVSVVFPSIVKNNVVSALMQAHPYEEVAYDIFIMENTNQHVGMGMIGSLDTAIEEEVFLQFVKNQMNAKVVRHSALRGKKVKKVAVLGGSGAFAINAAKAAGADVYITADVKYHEFYQAENQLVIADIGHYETEQFTKNLLVDYLTKKIPNFAVRLSESKTNPIKYL